MAQKYRVKLSDGRTFDVQTEGGPPSEADVLASLGGSGSSPAAEPAREPPRNRLGPVDLPPDVAAQYAALQDQRAGRAPTPSGDAVLENAHTLAGWAPAIGGTVGMMVGGPPGAAVGGGAGKVLDLAVNPEARASTVPRMAGQVALDAAVSAAVPAAAEWARAAVPARAATAAAFQDVMGAAKNVPIDINAPGTVALRIQELAERGGSMPKVVRDFLRRATDPTKGPMVYEEARDFYSNISRLSADEFKRLTPVVSREVGNLRAALSASLEDATSKVGKLVQYQQAMSDYARRAAADKFAGDVWTGVKRYIPIATAVGLGNEGMKRLSELMGGILGD